MPATSSNDDAQVFLSIELAAAAAELHRRARAAEATHHVEKEQHKNRNRGEEGNVSDERAVFVRVFPVAGLVFSIEAMRLSTLRLMPLRHGRAKTPFVVLIGVE